MHAETHATVREGLLVGLLGGGAVLLWWLVVDLLSGAPLATPSALGEVLLGGDRPTGDAALDMSAVGVYAIAHFTMFAVLGLVLIRLVHLVTEHLELRMGLWIAIVLTAAWLTLHTYVLARYTRHGIPLWGMVGAAVVGIAHHAGGYVGAASGAPALAPAGAARGRGRDPACAARRAAAPDLTASCADAVRSRSLGMGRGGAVLGALLRAAAPCDEPGRCHTPSRTPGEGPWNANRCRPATKAPTSVP